MQNNFIFTPKITHEVKEVITIADLIPEGRENAISRALLTEKCVTNGLIDRNVKDKDRAMRNLIEKARIDGTILNRGKSIFKNLQNAKKLYEDLKAGRLNE